MAPLLMSACVSSVPSGTTAACDALRPYLPKVSTQDTRQTKADVLRFYEVFGAVCDGEKR